jgi:hypothetical protein
MTLPSLQLLQLAKMCDLPDLLKQLNSSPFNPDIVDNNNKQTTLLPAPTIHSGDSSPLASTSPAAFNLPPMALHPLPLNPAVCAGRLFKEKYTN